MKIALDQIQIAPNQNARRSRATEDIDRLAQSMTAIGQTQAILVRVNLFREIDEPEYQIIDGETRYHAAKALGWSEIEATTSDRTNDVPVLAQSAAANMVRATMPALDQWRAVVAMQEQGYALGACADALGLTHRAVLKLDKLGRLHPSVLELVERFGLPTEDVLSAVVQADPQVQARAAAGKDVVTGGKRNPTINWPALKMRCIARRISATRAIFDWKESGLAFDEDLFAEPDSPDQWTTSDVNGFIKHQTVAVKALVDKRCAAGDRACFGDYDPKKGILWQAGLLHKDDRQLAAKGIRSIWYKVDANGYVSYSLVDDKVRKKADRTVAVEHAGNGAAEPEQEQAPITYKGELIIAQAKEQAIQDALESKVGKIALADLIYLLICTLGASNVSVQGQPTGTDVPVEEGRGGRFADLIAEGRDLSSNAMTSDAEFTAYARRAAAAAIARVMICPASKLYTHSGLMAEVVGSYLHADEYHQRFDTTAFLDQVNGGMLRELCSIAGIEPGKVRDMRNALNGALPNWQPPGAAFLADEPNQQPEQTWPTSSTSPPTTEALSDADA